MRLARDISDERTGPVVEAGPDGEPQVVGFRVSEATAKAIQMLPRVVKHLMAQVKANQERAHPRHELRVDVTELVVLLHLVPTFHYTNMILREDVEILLAACGHHEYEYDTTKRLPQSIVDQACEAH